MSYAVGWCEDGGPLFAGRLELLAGALHLDGRADESVESERELPYEEIVGVRFERDAEGRIGNRPTLALELRYGPRLLLASVGGTGSLREIADAVEAMRGDPRSDQGGGKPESRQATLALL
jgi:hypothetical protein